MKLSVETFILREMFSDEEALRMIRKAGFDAYDYSFYWGNDQTDMLGEDYLQRAMALRQLGESLNISCNQAHDPFEVSYGDKFDLDNRNYLRLVRCLEFASVLGANHVIVHAIKDNLPEGLDFIAYNRQFYESLIPWCEKFGICICVENLFNWQEKAIPVLCNPTEHQDFVRQLNSPWVKICVDVGHSAITGYKPEEVLAAMDPQLLAALHIHDNDGFRDQHLLPGQGCMDWNAITAALGNIGYLGDFTFELTGYWRSKQPEQMAAALLTAQQEGRKLINQIDAYRQGRSL